MTPVPKRILPVIAISQFAGTSVWFAINAVMADLQRSVALPASAVGWLTAAVQLGFILGTFGFALLSIADRFSPRKVFLVCSLIAAALALATALLPPQYGALLALRFLTGIALAGIYPVGMKIAAGWFAHGLGWALGVLVGALVLGTALPFGLRALGALWSWQAVMLAVAGVAAGGGVLMAVFVPDGPHLAPAARITPRALGVIWHDAQGACLGLRLLRPHVGAVRLLRARAGHRAAALAGRGGLVVGVRHHRSGPVQLRHRRRAGAACRRRARGRLPARQQRRCAACSRRGCSTRRCRCGAPGCSGGAPPCRATRRSSARSPPPTRREPWSAAC